jgi:hypothetical protein
MRFDSNAENTRKIYEIGKKLWLAAGRVNTHGPRITPPMYAFKICALGIWRSSRAKPLDSGSQPAIFSVLNNESNFFP